MSFIARLISLLFLCSSCSTILVYSGDVYQANECISRNALIMDHQFEDQLFFYDTNRIGHFLVGDITVKNSTDTIIIKKFL